MNIFVLDANPAVAARFHCDKHVSKMILESAQMLSTVLGGSYKPTHANHPCTLWVGASHYNAVWLIKLAYFLNAEWRARYGHDRDHKSIAVVNELATTTKLFALPDAGLTPFALAMPDEYKSEDAVQSYRAYYGSKSFAKWRNGAPDWW